MVIHTGSKNRQGTRAVAPQPRAGSAPRLDDKAVVRFAPNFSVYVLPTGSVCLYSEDRKFFLHGELYCALADQIGQGGARVRDLVRALEKTFPSDAIHEAVRRLVERRYALAEPRASAAGPVAAYWASIGLPPGTAEKSLKACRVRVDAIGVKGARELGAALEKLGVRVVKGAADLTVTLVNDYLERDLAELNRKRVADRKPWLLVQPAGVVPLVGPVFRSGEGACWTCLFDRMIRNREVRGFLERGSARRVAVSPLVHNPVGQGFIQLAAIEIAKAIATTFRTDLNDNIISFDLAGATIARHYVSRRPQCPTCGSKALTDPNRAPAPVELVGGTRLLMTSGGYRSVSSRATVARNRRHVSPLTGVVSRLERIDVDLPLNTNYFAGHNFSAPAMSVDELRSGLQGGSFGKGSTAEQGEASALMEAIERYSGIFQGDEIRVTRRYTDFAPGEAILPNEVLLFSDAQYRKRLAQIPGTELGEGESTPTPAPFNRSAETEWSPVWSLRDQRFKFLPTGLLYFFYRGESDINHINSDSNGCAAGNTREEAIVQGFLELVERDSYAIWWYNRVRRPALDLSRFEDSYVRDLQTQLAATGRKVWVIDITNDLGIPSYVAMSHATENGRDFVEYGSGSHFDARIALLRALTELNQFLSIGLMGARDAGGTDEAPFRLADHPYLLPNDDPPVQPDFAPKFGQLDTREQVLACVDVAKRLGLDFLVLDQTRPDIDVPVVRVIVPGLRHFYRRFGPGRLYDVPVKLGWLERPTPEGDLNPMHPHT
jgi:oxazoline/thiazoline synthase